MSADRERGVTLCIPTKDRPAFLERLLRYYAQTRSPHWIFIGDSSEPAQVEQNRRTVASFSRRLQIVHQEYPGLSTGACLEALSRLIETPYCACVADDDVLSTPRLERCAAFLERHPECSAAHGKGIMLQVEGGRLSGAIGSLFAYPQAVVQADTGAERLREFFTVSLAVVLFSVHRTATWREMFQGVTELQGVMSQNIFKDELIPTCISVVRGKITEIDGLYLVRQAHDAIYRQPHVYDWLTNPAWFPSYQIFHDRIVEELRRQDGLSLEQAQAALKAGFWPYLAYAVINTWRKGPARARRWAPSRLRSVAQRIPGLRKGWRTMRGIVMRSRDPWSLPALVQPSSPYHEEFMPIYEAITSPLTQRPAGDPTDGSGDREATMAALSAHD